MIRFLIKISLCILIVTVSVRAEGMLEVDKDGIIWLNDYEYTLLSNGDIRLVREFLAYSAKISVKNMGLSKKHEKELYHYFYKVGHTMPYFRIGSIWHKIVLSNDSLGSYKVVRIKMNFGIFNPKAMDRGVEITTFGIREPAISIRNFAVAKVQVTVQEFKRENTNFILSLFGGLFRSPDTLVKRNFQTTLSYAEKMPASIFITGYSEAELKTMLQKNYLNNQNK